MLAAEAPKITDWMQAWGSIAGLVMSTAAVIFTGLLFRHEIRVRREEKADTNAAQARLVVGKAIRVRRPPDGLGGESQQGPGTGIVWQVKNYSSMPAFNLRVMVRPVLGVVPSLGEFSREYEYVADLVEDVVEGYAESTHPIRPSEGGFELWKYEIIVRFTDAAGLVWQRSNHSRSPYRILTEAITITLPWRIRLWRFTVRRFQLFQVKVLRTRKLKDVTIWTDDIPF